MWKHLLLCVFCTFLRRDAGSLKLEEPSRWLLPWCFSKSFLLLSAANRNLHEFPSDRQKKTKERRRRTRLWAPASKLIGLWPIWPQGPSSPTRPIRAQTSCSATGRRGGATADYNQRKSAFNRHTNLLHFFWWVRELHLVSYKAAKVSYFTHMETLQCLQESNEFHHIQILI